MYLVYHGKNYSDGFLRALYHRRSDAEKDIRAEGYKLEKSTGLFLNDIGWYRVDHMPRIDRLA